MNWESVATVAVCVACLFAVSTAASTMESTVTTTPDDVINIDSSELPVGSDSAIALKSQVQSEGGPNEDGGGAADGSGSTASGGGEGEDDSKSRDGDGEQSGSVDADSGSESASSSSDEQSKSGGSDSSSGTSPVPSSAESLLDRLVDLLQALLGLLGALLPVAALVAALALAVKYRDALVAAVRARLEDWGLVEPEPEVDASEHGPVVSSEPAPETDVAEAWYEFVEALGLGDVRSATPRECAEHAREAGVDESVVDDVSEPFAEVKYGRAPETEERRRRARNGLERFRAQYDGGRR